MHKFWYLYELFAFPSAPNLKKTKKQKKPPQIVGACNNFQQIKLFDFSHALRLYEVTP